MPTLLELAGVPAGEIDGESLLQVDGDRPAVIAGTDKGALTQLAVRKPPWKLILHVESGEEEAYDLETDPRELDSRPADAPPELREIAFRELEIRRAPRADGGRGGDGGEAALGPRLPVMAPLAQLYERMYFIRRFEESLLDLFSQGKLVGTTHTYIGQEANGVGIIDHLEPERDVVFSNHRCHGHYLAFTDDAFGLLCEVMGKAPGVCGGKGGSQHLCKGNFYSNGVLGSIVPVATGIALAEKKKGTGAVSTVFLGDGTLGEGVTYESLNIASLWKLPVLFVVENNHYAQSTPVELELAGSIPARAAAFGIETAELDDDRRRGGARTGRPRGRAHPRDRRAVLPRPRHVPLQPALEGRRQSRPGRDREAARARPARRGGRAPGRRRAPRDRGALRGAPGRHDRGGRGSARRDPGGGMSKRCVQVLNGTLHELFAERDDVFLLGEDVLDPYGGAFKVTQGLSDAYPDRVLTTPISEASLFGVAAGMALRGQRPILEIMFGDFIALGFDQIVNGIAKFREMYDDQVTVPLVVRTPMGGRRGYGPTHSQSLEKLLLGVPNIVVVAASECHDLRGLLVNAVEDERPVFFIENKLMYGRPNRRPEERHIGELAVRETGTRYPALTFSGTDFSEGSATVVTYGGMVPVVLDAVTELILEHEIFCEVVALSQLLPMELEPVLESVARTGALVTAEEGTLTGGFGAEIAARVQEAAWSDLRGPVQRVAARDGIIPSARPLEDAMLPSAQDVVEAILVLEGVRS